MLFIKRIRGRRISDNPVERLLFQFKDTMRSRGEQLGSMYQQKLISLIDKYQTTGRVNNVQSNRQFVKNVRDAVQNTVDSYIKNVTDSWIDWTIEHTIGEISGIGPYASKVPKYIIDGVEWMLGEVKDKILDTVADGVIDSLPDSLFDKGTVAPNKVQDAVDNVNNWLNNNDSSFRAACAPDYNGPLFQSL